MIRMLGIREPVYKNFTDNYDQVIGYANSSGRIIEFCEYSYLRTYNDHVEIEIADISGNHVLMSISNIDFYRIEID